MNVKLHLIVNSCIVTIVIMLALTIIFFGSLTGIKKKILHTVKLSIYIVWCICGKLSTCTALIMGIIDKRKSPTPHASKESSENN